jgi:predicted ATPase
MLKRLYVNNFRSLLNFEFKPCGMNLLIGPNNAGKTNLCSALRFLGLSSMATLENAALVAVGETWNLSNVYIESRQIEFTMECTLPYKGQQLDFKYELILEAVPVGPDLRKPLRLVREELVVTGGGFQQGVLLGNEKGQAKLLDEEHFDQGGIESPGERLDRLTEGRAVSPKYTETQAPDDATMLFRLLAGSNNPRASLFRTYLAFWFYFSLQPEALRSPDVVRGYTFLRHDGANLARSLFVLHNERPRLEKNLIQWVNSLEPKLDLFTFVNPDPEHVYLFLEDESDHRFGTRGISDGTLRFLAMAYVILEGSKLRGEDVLTPLVIIEEPENGVYVGQLKPLFKRIDASGKGGQFIFTSHNPYFIDLFDSNIDGIHVMKQGKQSSILVRPEPEKVRKLLDQMPLGEMHYREMLG